MSQIILHIPHSSTNIPFLDGYMVSKADLEKEQMLLTDWYTDDLFEHQDSTRIVAGFSRLFCDVERFADDSMEAMSGVGMGVIYERRDDGTPLREVSAELRMRILNDYYRIHHQKLTEAVDRQLREYGKAIIIDCHSFPDIPLKRDLNQNLNRPDYCVGTDNFHTSDELLKAAQGFLGDKGLSVGFNAPYSGSIVPLKHYLQDKRVQTIMLEINRRLYLEPNSNMKSYNYSKIKATVKSFITSITCGHQKEHFYF